jgi:hypothetical protein
VLNLQFLNVLVPTNSPIQKKVVLLRETDSVKTGYKSLGDASDYTGLAAQNQADRKDVSINLAKVFGEKSVTSVDFKVSLCYTVPENTVLVSDIIYLTACDGRFYGIPCFCILS